MIKAFGEQLFRSGFIHGDPHPANGEFNAVNLLVVVSDVVCLFVIYLFEQV